jgi:glycosyltransferase involved in cell wall biosynthesis
MIVLLNPWDRFMGPNRYLFEILRHAPDLRSQSLVVFPADGETAEEYRRLGCRTEIWTEASLLRTAPSPTNVLGLIRSHTIGLIALLRHLKRVSPAVVITNTENLWIGGIACRLLGVPHAQVFHALGFENRLGRRRSLLRLYLRTLGSWNHFLIAVSQTVASGLERGGAASRKIITIPNPIPVSDLLRDSTSLPDAMLHPHQSRSPFLLSVGHLSPMKGQDLLIEAVASLVPTFPSIFCLLVGGRLATTGLDDTVDFEKKLHERVRELSLEDHVGFLGDSDNIPSLLRHADLYVQPSRTESFGRVVAEALTCGTPVVAFDIGGIPEVSGPGALLASAGDARALAACIEKALASPADSAERTRAGREWVTSRYDASKLAPEFASMVATLQNSGRG